MSEPPLGDAGHSEGMARALSAISEVEALAETLSALTEGLDLEPDLDAMSEAERAELLDTWALSQGLVSVLQALPIARAPEVTLAALAYAQTLILDPLRQTEGEIPADQVARRADALLIALDDLAPTLGLVAQRGPPPETERPCNREAPLSVDS